MAYTFKLSDPGQQPGKGVCQVPTWLEEHLSHISSNFDPQILGKVDISLIHSKPFNYSEHNDGVSWIFGDFILKQNIEISILS